MSPLTVSPWWLLLLIPLCILAAIGLQVLLAEMHWLRWKRHHSKKLGEDGGQSTALDGTPLERIRMR